MHRAALWFLVIAGVYINAVAQPAAPVQLWDRTYGGPGFEKANAITPTSDGGFVLAHMSSSYGAGDFDRYVVKTDSLGDPFWTTVYGGTEWDETWAVWECANGSLMLVGCSQSGNGSWDGYVSKIEANGEEEWFRYYGTERADCFFDGMPAPDGGAILAGITYSMGAGSGDFYLVRTNLYGEPIWEQAYGGNLGERAWSMAGTSDGGYVLTGYCDSYTSLGTDVFVVKTDSAGTPQWSRMVIAERDQQARDIAQTADGGYIIAGYADDLNLNRDLQLVRLAADGNVLWSRVYGGDGMDWAYAVLVDDDGGFIAAGCTERYGENSGDAWLIKTDSLGNLLWSQAYGGDSEEEFSNIIPYSDGFIAIGATKSWGAGDWDFWMVRLRESPSEVEPRIVGIAKTPALMQNFPNPFNAATNIAFMIPRAMPVHIDVADITGKTVASLTDAIYQSGEYVIAFDARHLSSGHYFYRLQTEEFSQTKRMVLVK